MLWTEKLQWKWNLCERKEIANDGGKQLQAIHCMWTVGIERWATAQRLWAVCAFNAFLVFVFLFIRRSQVLPADANYVHSRWTAEAMREVIRATFLALMLPLLMIADIVLITTATFSAEHDVPATCKFLLTGLWIRFIALFSLGIFELEKTRLFRAIAHFAQFCCHQHTRLLLATVVSVRVRRLKCIHDMQHISERSARARLNCVFNSMEKVEHASLHGKSFIADARALANATK